METKTNLCVKRRSRLTCSSLDLCPPFGDTITVDCVVLFFVPKQAFTLKQDQWRSKYVISLLEYIQVVKFYFNKTKPKAFLSFSFFKATLFNFSGLASLESTSVTALLRKMPQLMTNDVDNRESYQHKQ